LIRFIHFFRVLKWYVSARSQKRTLADWGQYIQQLVENLVLQPALNEGDDDYLGLLKHIEQLNVLAATYNEAISFEVFKHSFLEMIGGETRSGAFATGGITFCSLIPMRSIPFRIVGLLGMDFDKFPRKEVPLSFNLMEGKRRKGDRNIKDNDRHLYLETLLSAQQYLYISYIGQNAKDNSVHPPSALLDELLDYIASGLKDTETAARNFLVTTQPLHGFSQQYFQHRHGLYSYLGDNALKKPLSPHQNVASTGPVFNWDEIPIHSLLEFFKNPFKWYYNKVLAVNYRSDQVLLPDTEIFELDKLQEWKLKCDLLKVGGRWPGALSFNSA
jgi:exodeoxyribonuclease V gamma subunit